MKKSLSTSDAEEVAEPAVEADIDDAVFEEEEEIIVVTTEPEQEEEDQIDGGGQEEQAAEDEEEEEVVVKGNEEEISLEDEQQGGKSNSPDTTSLSNATENVLYQEIPMRPKNTSPPLSIDDYAEPQLIVTSPLPSTHSSIASSSAASTTSAAAIPISTNGSPLYAQVHKEPRTEIQKIHSTIPNTFKSENLGCMLTTFGTKTPSMMMMSGGSGQAVAGGSSRHQQQQQLLASSYSNDLNSSKDSMLGSLDMLSDSGNHSDSWMYPQGGRGGGGDYGRRKGRAPPSSFTDQLNQVLADRERCVAN